tara:strand:+ start:856 stop:1563 length:708 start_codon:yes stop_codon:yes gene_type:complete
MNLDDKINTQIIIARYKEDLSWLDPYCSDYKITVYNKGPELSNHKFTKLLELPNVGRESHTYLYHIVKNYNTLDKYLIFLQGRIDDLYPITFSDPNDYIQKIKKYGYAVRRLALLGPLHWKDNLGIELDQKYKSEWNRYRIKRSNLGFREFSKSFFPQIPWLVATSYGGCFGVSRERVLTHPKSFYLKLLNILNNSSNPIEGHYLERLWCYLFSKNKLLIYSYLDILKTKIETLQ